jgi:vacuolar-type H+-ATPase subunit H
MEMIDVLQRLKEIAESKPELVKDAVENVERTNPKVDESRMKDYLHDEAEKLSREEFIKKHGESLAGFWDSINGTEEATEGKMPAGLKAYHDKKAGKEDKKETVKEAIQISADTPQEASMMMQLLKLAGVQPVDQAMISQGEARSKSWRRNRITRDG